MSVELSSLVMPALVTPPVLYAAAMAQRHVGQAAAGLVATLPSQLAIGSVAVGLALGDKTAAEFGLHAATYLAAMVAYGVAFAWGMRRGGPVLAVACAGAAYLICVVPLLKVAPVLACAIGLAALAVGTRVHAKAPSAPQLSGSLPPLWVTVAVGTVAVLGVVTLVAASGAVVGAVLAAVPVVSTTLALLSARSQGRESAAHIMAGLNQGLTAYFAFAVTMAAGATRLTTLGAAALGLVISGSVAFVSWRVMRD